MMDLDIFKFENPREFLNAAFAKKKERNSRFSLRAWARQLGYKNPSLLSAVMRGERSLKPDLAARIIKTLGGQEEELKYFELLVLIHNARSVAEKESYIRILETIRPEKKYFSLDLEKFRFMAEWYHLAVLEMIELSDFVEDPAFISKRLQGAISPAAVLLVIDRLLRLRLVQRNSNGRLQKTRNVLEIGDATPNDAIRTHHLQMIDLARQLVAEKDVAERFAAGSTIAIRKENWDKALKLVEDFHRKLSRLGAHGDGDEVCRINTQAFKLTSASAH